MSHSASSDRSSSTTRVRRATSLTKPEVPARSPLGITALPKVKSASYLSWGTVELWQLADCWAGDVPPLGRGGDCPVGLGRDTDLDMPKNITVAVKQSGTVWRMELFSFRHYFASGRLTTLISFSFNRITHFGLMFFVTSGLPLQPRDEEQKKVKTNRGHFRISTGPTLPPSPSLLSPGDYWAKKSQLWAS